MVKLTTSKINFAKLTMNKVNMVKLFKSNIYGQTNMHK
jgi:hypothetical protein